MLPLVLALVVLASPPAESTVYRLDFTENLILGDTYPGPLLQTLSKHANALDACLVGIEKQFDAIGGVVNVDIAVTPEGGVKSFGFREERLAPQSACLRRVIAGVRLPEGRNRLGLLKLKRTAPAGAGSSVHSASIDGLDVTLTAQPIRLADGRWSAEVRAVVRPNAEAHGLGEKSLAVIGSVYRPDGSSTHVASWSTEIPAEEASCVARGQEKVLKRHDEGARAGEVVHSNVWVVHGPCRKSLKDRSVVGAVELVVSADDKASVTLWSPGALDSRPKPFEDVRERARQGLP